MEPYTLKSFIYRDFRRFRHFMLSMEPDGTNGTSTKTLIRPEIFGDVKMFHLLRVVGTLTAPPSEITNTPRGHPCNPAMHLGMKPNRPKPGPHNAAAPAQIVTTLGDAPPVCAWHGQRPGHHHSRQDRPSRCRRDDSRPDDGADDRPHAGRRGWTQTEGRTIAEMDAQPVRRAHRAAQPQPVRIAENTPMHLSL